MSMQYDVAVGSNTHKLKDAVEKAITGGWRPLGGVAVVTDANGYPIFAQALIKDEVS